MKYEYQVVPFCPDITEGNNAPHVAKLNELAAEGWHVVASLPSVGGALLLERAKA